MQRHEESRLKLEFWDGTTRTAESVEILRTWQEDPAKPTKKCMQCDGLEFHEVRLKGLDPSTRFITGDIKHMCTECKRVTEIM